MIAAAVPLLAEVDANELVPEFSAVWRLLTGAGLGALVGLEREASDQPAGLRTHLTVALGASLFGVISTLGFSEFVSAQRDVNIQFDVTRVASQVVVGIGFLGAGMIFRSGSKIRNLTTAASLWVTAAIGLATGVGDIGIAAVATAAILVALLLLRLPKKLVRERVTRPDVRVAVRLARYDDGDSVIDALRRIEGVDVHDISWSKSAGDPVVTARLMGRAGLRPEAELGPIVARDDVLELESGEPAAD